MEQIKLSHPDEYYENIFNMYKDTNENGDMYYFYNIGKKITLPDNRLRFGCLDFIESYICVSIVLSMFLSYFVLLK